MARVFTTRFHFNHQVHHAIVTVISRNGQSNFNVKLRDQDLSDLLTDGHLNYTGENGFKNVSSSNHLAEALINCIAFSVEEHLSVQP